MRRVLIILLITALAVSFVAGTAGAQSRSQYGTIVVIESDETVNGFTAYARTVIVRGTVQGDLTVIGGRVEIAEGGKVTGRVRVVAATTQIGGTIGQNTVTYAGQTTVTDTAQINGSFGGVGGNFVLGGQFNRDVTTVAGRVTLTDTANVDGLLVYTGQYINQGGSIRVGSQHISELALFPSLTGAARVAFLFYLVLAEALAGTIVLKLFPGFIRAAEEVTRTDPIQVGVAGIIALVGIPLLSAIALLTIVGLPLAVAAIAGFTILLWAGSIIGRYLVGHGVLSYTEYESRVLALVVGLVLLTVVSLIPYVGGPIWWIVTIMGVGTVALGMYDAYVASSSSPAYLP